MVLRSRVKKMYMYGLAIHVALGVFNRAGDGEGVGVGVAGRRGGRGMNGSYVMDGYKDN